MRDGTAYRPRGYLSLITHDTRVRTRYRENIARLLAIGVEERSKSGFIRLVVSPCTPRVFPVSPPSRHRLYHRQPLPHTRVRSRGARDDDYVYRTIPTVEPILLSSTFSFCLHINTVVTHAHIRICTCKSVREIFDTRLSIRANVGK